MNPVRQKLLKLKNPIRAKLLAGFFKTGVGEYGEGDIFWGITVPMQRVVAKEFVSNGAKFSESKEILQELLKDSVHECRFTALLILTYLYGRAEKNKNNMEAESEKKKIFDFYIKNIKFINNWDLVDVTCHRIVGAYLYGRDRELLYKLARSKNLWEKRIAIVSTFHFIARRDFSDSLKIGEMLLTDKHDLIHKAVGWMLREVGKKDEVVLHNFLKKHCKTMARTTLRYSIERLPEDFRRHYMRQ